MSKISILIPSYKRPEVLRVTLAGLSASIAAAGYSLPYSIGIYVGLNKVSEDVRDVVVGSKLAMGPFVDFRWLEFPDNIGKACCLNNLFATFARGSTYVVTLDNDMQIKRPWFHLIDKAAKTDFEMMGFASTTFWAHIPNREHCKFFEVDGHKIYSADGGIAGGMLLFPYYFLERHPWTNMGGVYGRDDEQMCTKTKRKYVLEWYEDWLVHEPLSENSSPDLINYNKKKKSFFDRKIYVLPKGWDE